MTALCIMMVLWAYNLFLVVAFFDIVLERRQSARTLIYGTVGFYIIICLLRLPVFWNTGLKYLPILNVLTQILLFVYQTLFFKGSLQKRILSIVLLMVFMCLGELVGGWLGYLVTGVYDIMDFQSEAYSVMCLIAFPVTAVCLYPLAWIWNMFQRIKWGDRNSWLCVLLPISQYLILESFMENYGPMGLAVSILILAGIILQGGGNFYMFSLFYRESQRIQAEKRLRREQELYRKEQIYYETLKENQKETARIRHDFQNYILVVQNIAQKRE